MTKPLVLISDKMDPNAAAIFRERGCEVDEITGLKPDELKAIIGKYDGLAIRSSTNVTREILDAATNLHLGSKAFLSAIGEVAGNTITAGAAGQTIGGVAGSDTLIGSTAFRDVFMGASAGLNNDIISNFGGSGTQVDKIDVTDLNYKTATLGYSGSTTQGTLTLGDGTHSLSISMVGNYVASDFKIGTDGHSGTFVTFV